MSHSTHEGRDDCTRCNTLVIKLHEFAKFELQAKALTTPKIYVKPAQI